MSHAAAGSGERVVTLASARGKWRATLAFSPDWQPIATVTSFSEAVPDEAWSTIGRASVMAHGRGEGTVSELSVRSGSALVPLSDDDWSLARVDSSDEAFLEYRRLQQEDGSLSYTIEASVGSVSLPVVMAAFLDTALRNVSFSAVAAPHRGQVGVSAGWSNLASGLVPALTRGDRKSEVAILVDVQQQAAFVRWAIPTLGTTFASEEGEVEQVFPVIPSTPYTLTVGGGLDRRLATIESPIRWFEPATEGDVFGTATVVDGIVLLSGGKTVRSFFGDEVLEYSSFDSPPAEMRVWETDRQRIGGVFPQDATLAIRRGGSNSFTGRVNIPSGIGVSQFGAPGPGPGQMSSPMSFDVGADGRIYVLDAGNARIQVFDTDGNYITQWGSFGSGPGQFDFSDPELFFGLGGSVAVASDGTIWVADIGNRRIQRFAP